MLCLKAIPYSAPTILCYFDNASTASTVLQSKLGVQICGFILRLLHTRACVNEMQDADMLAALQGCSTAKLQRCEATALRGYSTEEAMPVLTTQHEKLSPSIVPPAITDTPTITISIW